MADEMPDLVALLEEKLNEYKKTVVEPLNPPSMKPDRNADPTNWFVFFINFRKTCFDVKLYKKINQRGDKWSPGWC